MTHLARAATRIAAVCNQKGGVGKTTLSINLGAALAHAGYKVCLVDLDPQGHLTEGVGMGELYLRNDEHTLYNALIGRQPPAVHTIVRQSRAEPFWVIPASFELMLAEQALFMARNREHKLTGVLKPLNGKFDWVLIDCPPALGPLTDNALNASRQVIIPIQAEATSVRAVELLFDQIESVEKGLDIAIEILAVVPNLVQDSTIARNTLSELRQSIPVVTPFEIKKRVMLQAAWSQGKSVYAYQPPNSSEEKIRQELTQVYEQLGRFITEGAREAVSV